MLGMLQKPRLSCRGTDGSNPVSSSEESANHRFRCVGSLFQERAEVLREWIRLPELINRRDLTPRQRAKSDPRSGPCAFVVFGLHIRIRAVTADRRPTARCSFALFRRTAGWERGPDLRHWARNL